MQNNQWKELNQVNIQDDIRGIAEDKDGTLWLGTYRNGVIRIKPEIKNGAIILGNHQYYKEGNGLPSLKNILPFHYKDKIIFGTPKGLYIHNPATDKFEPFCGLGKQFCDGSRDVYRFVEDAQGKIWLSGENKAVSPIGVLTPDGKGGFAWDERPFKRIPDMYVEALYVEPNGQVAWIGGSEGLFRYDATVKKDYDRYYPALVRKVVAGDSVLYWGDLDPEEISRMTLNNRPALDYGHNSLHFEYAATDYEDETRRFFRYRLVGYDTAWSEWTKEAKKEYTNLHEGNYHFEVQAKNVYETLSGTGTYHFKILPPWYRTWWAYFAYLVAGVFGIWAGVKRYTLHLTREKIRLEEIVATRTAEVVQQKEEIQIQAESLQEINEELGIQAENLRVAYEQLKDMEQFKEGLTGMIVHDLKNPLNNLMVLSSQEKGVPAMKQVGQTSQQMLRMVMDILDIQKLESPELQLHIETKKLYEIVQEVVLQIAFLAEEKLIQVQNLIPEDATVEADTALLTRVFENLLTNAIKYSPIEGSVKIQVHPVAEALIEISISDTGKGMPADKLGGIFDKFSQIEAKNSGKIRSTGLGLAFCKLAIEAHQGKIWAESELGKGSIFKFIMKGSVEDEGVHAQEMVKQPLVYTDADIVLIRQMQQAISQFSLYQGAAILEKTQPFVLPVTQNAGAKHWLDELHAVLLHYDEERFEQLKNHP